MVVLPSGFEAPPFLYTFALASATILVTAMLFAVDPPIDQKLVLALVPWMVVGGGLHAFYQIGVYPPVIRPLFGTPAAYFSTYVLIALVWAVIAVWGTVSGGRGDIGRNLAVAGLLAVVALVILAGRYGAQAGDFSPVWPAVAVVVALLNTVFTVTAIGLWETPVILRTRYVGPSVVFAHALDGVTTAIGADVLTVHERTPIPRAIMDLAAELPVAETIGVGWAFLLVKLLVAAAIVVAFSSYVDEEPAQATLILAFVTAVGLGPAANNLFIFLVGAA